MKNPFEIEGQEFFEQQKENALSVVVKKATKESIQLIANKIVDDIRSNDEDYLNAYIQAKAIEEISKSIIDQIKPDAMEEASTFEKDQKFNGCTVSIKNLADSYDFSDDEEWNNLVKQEADIKKRKKDLELLMVQASKVAQLVDKDGVVITPARIKSYGGATLSITLPKQ